MRISSRVLAASMVVAMLGGGIAYAGDDATGGDETTETTKTTDVTDSTHPAAPEELVAAVNAYRSAVSEWRHCIIDMVTGDAESDTCGGAPNPDDFGLSEEDILNYDLDERLAKRVDRLLTRVEIKTTCLAAHAAEGRSAVFECVFAAIEAQFGDHADRVGDRQACGGDEASETAVAAPEGESDKGATDGACQHNGERVRDRRGDRGGDGGTDRAGEDTGGRRGTRDA